MKLKVLLFSVLLIGSFYSVLFAEEGCSSCSHGHSEAAATKADESCPDGVCAAETKSEKPSAQVEEAKEESPATINTPGLKTLISSGVPLTILDARSGKWDDGKRLPGALSLNFESKPEEIAKVLPKKDSLVITYCSNLKCPASHKLYTHLKSLGYTNLIEYPEGIQGWIEAGNPVNEAK